MLRYLLGKFDANPASIAATGDASLADTVSGTYTWPNSDPKPRNRTMGKVFVQLSHDAGGDAYVRWNSTTISATGDWDVRLEPGESVASPDWINVDQVTILSAGATLTYETDYTIRGWVDKE